MHEREVDAGEKENDPGDVTCPPFDFRQHVVGLAHRLGAGGDQDGKEHNRQRGAHAEHGRQDEARAGLDRRHQTGEEEPGRKEKIDLHLPPEIDLQPIPPDKYLSRMLEEKEVDAMFAARAPSSFTKGSPNVARLFENPREVEEQYYLKTGIFPIMHTVILKRDIYEKNPWIAMNLYKAFCSAKDMVIKSYHETAALHVTLPWVHDEIERTKKILDEDWWPYGLKKNRKVLETFLRYHHDQGLSASLLAVEDLFAPETMDDEFKI